MNKYPNNADDIIDTVSVDGNYQKDAMSYVISRTKYIPVILSEMKSNNGIIDFNALIDSDNHKMFKHIPHSEYISYWYATKDTAYVNHFGKYNNNYSILQVLLTEVPGGDGFVNNYKRKINNLFNSRYADKSKYAKIYNSINEKYNECTEERIPVNREVNKIILNALNCWIDYLNKYTEYTYEDFGGGAHWLVNSLFIDHLLYTRNQNDFNRLLAALHTSNYNKKLAFSNEFENNGKPKDRVLTLTYYRKCRNSYKFINPLLICYYYNFYKAYKDGKYFTKNFKHSAYISFMCSIHSNSVSICKLYRNDFDLFTDFVNELKEPESKSFAAHIKYLNMFNMVYNKTEDELNSNIDIILQILEQDKSIIEKYFKNLKSYEITTSRYNKNKKNLQKITGYGQSNNEHNMLKILHSIAYNTNDFYDYLLKAVTKDNEHMRERENNDPWAWNRYYEIPETRLKKFLVMIAKYLNSLTISQSDFRDLLLKFILDLHESNELITFGSVVNYMGDILNDNKKDVLVELYLTESLV